MWEKISDYCLDIPFFGYIHYFGYGRNPCYSILVICYDSEGKAMV